MAVTEVSICNMALSRIGHTTISALSDANDAARQCNLHYEPSRDGLLRAHPWNFAMKRTRLITQAETAKSIVSATVANPVVLEVTGHGYSDGNRVKVKDVAGMTALNDRLFPIDVLTANTFSLLNENGLSYAAYTGSGTVTKVPANDFEYWFALPSDSLRVWTVDGDTPGYEYRVEGGRILAHSDAVDVVYISQVTDTAQFDSQFVDILAQKLAAEVSQKLSDNANLTASLWQVYERKLSEARTFDAQESGMGFGIKATNWLNARY